MECRSFPYLTAKILELRASELKLLDIENVDGLEFFKVAVLHHIGGLIVVQPMNVVGVKA